MQHYVRCADILRMRGQIPALSKWSTQMCEQTRMCRCCNVPVIWPQRHSKKALFFCTANLPSSLMAYVFSSTSKCSLLIPLIMSSLTFLASLTYSSGLLSLSSTVLNVFVVFFSFSSTTLRRLCEELGGRRRRLNCLASQLHVQHRELSRTMWMDQSTSFWVLVLDGSFFCDGSLLRYLLEFSSLALQFSSLYRCSVSSVRGTVRPVLHNASSIPLSVACRLSFLHRVRLRCCQLTDQERNMNLLVCRLFVNRNDPWENIAWLVSTRVPLIFGRWG